MIEIKELNKIIYEKFLSLNVQSNVAKDVTKSLVRATSRGINSHGVNLLYHYGQSVLSGRKNGNPNYEIKSKYPAAFSLNGDHTFGASAGFEAIRKANEIVNKYGIASIGVYNSTHCASMSSIALNAIESGNICFAFTHADSLMKSPNVKTALFGTNPICIAAPGISINEPICLDMATTKISWNKLKNYLSENNDLPNSVAADIDGNNIVDPKKAKSLLPIGDYKGFALASMIDLLCGVLLGMNFGTNIPNMYKTDIKTKRFLGQFYIVLKPDFFLKMEEYNNLISQFITMINQNKVSKYPGQIENENEIKNVKNGLILNATENTSLSNFLKL
jgi:ureidoglycolate dehydrogenase (NAD+)